MTDEEILQLDFYDFCGNGALWMTDEDKLKWYKDFMGLMTKNAVYNKVYAKVIFSDFTPSEWRSLVAFVDNGFLTSNKDLSIKREKDYYCITTDWCDNVSLVRVHCQIGGKGITKIERLCDDTDGWQEVRQETYERIEKFLESRYERANSN